ncbi:MAG: hypothetical protein JRH20_10275 [Deltaproteobacteria bacterium]|nr:hypothetical protein [Deltaproteobacteria bacterium]
MVLRMLLPLTLLLITACGETAIKLSVDKREISAGGIEFATITAQVIVDGDSQPNANVEFETSSGSFDATSDVQYVSSATGPDGKTQIKLYSASRPGQANVTADFSDDNTGVSASASIAVTFTEAGPGARPVDGKVRLTCDAVNIGAFREPVPDINVTCMLTAETRDGKAIPATALNAQFRTEAGAITPFEDTYTGKLKYIYNPRGGNSAPKDVQPDPTLNEPSYFDANGIQRNPRDGVVTIIAIVDGEEAFTDINGNGTYDPGEPFVDSAEPFLDEDDNDSWSGGEVFIDLDPKNGQWDQGNGVWDADTKVVAIYKLVWSGAVDSSIETSKIETFATDIFDSGKIDLTAIVVDKNLNPVAAFQPNGDNIEWILIGGDSDATSTDDPTPPMINAYGFSFDKAANTERQRWAILTNTFTATKYKFTVEDGYPSDEYPAASYTLTVKVHTTPGPSAEGYYLDQHSESVGDRIQGTCD